MDERREWRTEADGSARGMRIDAFWSERLAPEGVSRAKIQEWIKDGLATLDGRACRKPGQRLDGGERLALRGQAVQTRALPEEGELRILYRDRSLLVLDKPAGLTVHPAPSCPDSTLVQRLLHHFPELAGLDAWRPGIVHRLDKDTSGLLVVALTEASRLKLAKAFAKREVHKTYLALVHGVPERESGRIDLPMGRHPTIKTRMAVLAKGGREAHTEYRVLWREARGRASLLSVAIHTGRTHQIRVHLSHIGHPIIGDRVYGASAQAGLEEATDIPKALMARQMLHAYRLSFTHPGTGTEMAFAATPPKDFTRLPLVLARRSQRVGIIGPAGCGKSTVAAYMAERGVPVFNADKVVAELYRHGADGWLMLDRRFGGRFTQGPDGGVDKAALLNAMRASREVRVEVMDIIHPLVQYRLEEFWRATERHPLAAAEIPLLVEVGWSRAGVVDVLLGVECPEAKRLELLVSKRGWPEDLAADIDSWQWPWPDKRRLCDLVVENSAGLPELRARTERALESLRQARVARTVRLRTDLAGFWSA